jgi:Phage integrase family
MNRRVIVETDLACHTASLLALNSGMRTSEICRLWWEQIDFEKRTLMVGHSKAPAGTVRTQHDCANGTVIGSYAWQQLCNNSVCLPIFWDPYVHAWRSFASSVSANPIRGIGPDPLACSGVPRRDRSGQHCFQPLQQGVSERSVVQLCLGSLRFRNLRGGEANEPHASPIHRYRASGIPVHGSLLSADYRVVLAEREGIRKIFTVDRRDFSVYRIHGRIRPSILP